MKAKKPVDPYPECYSAGNLQRTPVEQLPAMITRIIKGSAVYIPPKGHVNPLLGGEYAPKRSG